MGSAAPMCLTSGKRSVTREVLACITWNPDHLQELSKAVEVGIQALQALSLGSFEVTDAQIASLCSSVGGVCGWSCGSNHPPETLPGCDAHGRIKVSQDSFAGKVMSTAKFEGEALER